MCVSGGSCSSFYHRTKRAADSAARKLEYNQLSRDIKDNEIENYNPLVGKVYAIKRVRERVFPNALKRKGTDE